MRFRLLRRRLTISAPRMSVRSALPWPFRWAGLAIVLGFCAAIGLWAFEFGKDIAGLDGGAKDDLVRARAELAVLRDDLAGAKLAREKAQSIADTASTVLTAEKAAQEGLIVQNRLLESDNRKLKDELGFFEKLIPSAGVQSIAVRGFQAEVLGGHQVKWQIMLMQALKNAPEFNGRLELSFAGVQNGKPWLATLPGGGQALKFRQYGRTEGVFELPAQTTVKTVSVRVLDGTAVMAAQSVKL